MGASGDALPGATALSVVVATRDGWPAYRRVFDSHRREVESVGGELLVLDGSRHPAPPADVLGPAVRWERRRGEGVLALRAHGYAAARGALVAQTEDHVRLAPGWAAGMVRAHREHPEAAAIGGAMDNGSRDTAVNRASFLIGYYRYLRPFGPARRVPVATWGLVAFKAWAAAGIARLGGVGVNEAHHMRRLSEGGAVILLDDRVSGEHIQALTTAQATRLHFHAGRSMAATRRARMDGREWARLAITPLSPLLLTANVGRTVLGRRAHLGDYVSSLPALLWLYTCRAAGELLGYAAGAGDSPAHLH